VNTHRIIPPKYSSTHYISLLINNQLDHEQQKATKTETPKMEQIFVPKHVPYSKESKKKFTPFFLSNYKFWYKSMQSKLTSEAKRIKSQSGQANDGSDSSLSNFFLLYLQFS